MGHNYVKNVGGVPVFISAYRLIMVHICTEFHKNILDGIKVIEWTRFSYEKFQWGIIP